MGLKMNALVCTGALIDSGLTSSEKCTTGCNDIDNLVGGGFFGGELVEVFGPPASGRTQLILSSVARVLADGFSVVYVDADGGFVGTRMRELLSQLVISDGEDSESRFLSRGEVESALDRLLVNRVCSWDELAGGVAHSVEDVVEQEPGVKVAVIDSLALPYRLCERQNAQKRLETFAGRMAQIAMRYNVIVFIVNNSRAVDGMTVSPRVGGDYSVYPQQVVHEVGLAAMGDIWAYLCSYRLGLGWSRDRRRVACLVKSSRMPRGRAHFQITSKGVVDDDLEA